MKKILVLLAMAMICSIAMAQSETTRTIHGAVVDKNGNPLPGAVVSATDGAETTLVNSDGTFSLEIPVWLESVTASYAGYKDKTMKPMFKHGMIFRLTPKNRHAFVNVDLGLAFHGNKEHKRSAFAGVMAGILDDWGFYGKGVYCFEPGTVQITAGAIKRIYNNFYAYLGLGYGGVTEYYEYITESNRVSDHYINYDGFAFEGGLIIGIGQHFDITVGYTHIGVFGRFWNYAPNISVGYVF